MSHNEDFLEALVGEFRRMMKGEFKGLHDRLDRLENARAGPRYANSYGQRRDTVPNRETYDDYYEDLRRRDTTRASSSYQANPWKPTFPKKEEKVQLFSHPKPKTEVPNPRMQGMAWCSIQPLENLDEEEDSVQEELVAASSIPTLEDVPDEECAVQGELLVALNSATPLEDTEEGEHAIQSELVVAMHCMPSLEDTDEEEDAVLEVFEASSALTMQIEEDVCFDAKIKEEKEAEEQFEDLEHFDFIGIEQILSMTCSKQVITSYLRRYWINFQLVFLAFRWGKNRSKASEYSKYLFRWRGRCQYLCNKDPMNSRTNSFQERGNDENMAGSKTWNADPIEVSTGPIIRSRTKALNGLIQGILEQSRLWRPIEGAEQSPQPWVGRGLQVAWTWPSGVMDVACRWPGRGLEGAQCGLRVAQAVLMMIRGVQVHQGVCLGESYLLRSPTE